MPGPSDWLAECAALLDGLGVPWVLAGAQAALEYRREERQTTDLDLYVAWDDRLVRAFEDAGYAVRAIAAPGDVPHLLQLRKGEQKIDLMVPVTEYQDLAVQRGRTERVLSVEDVIIHKLLAWRPRDQDDVLSILAVDHDLDLDYVEHWAQEWGVTDRWHEARST